MLIWRWTCLIDAGDLKLNIEIDCDLKYMYKYYSHVNELTMQLLHGYLNLRNLGFWKNKIEAYLAHFLLIM